MNFKSRTAAVNVKRRSCMTTILIKGAAALYLVPGRNYPVLRFAVFTVGGLFSAAIMTVLAVHRFKTGHRAPA